MKEQLTEHWPQLVNSTYNQHPAGNIYRVGQKLDN